MSDEFPQGWCVQFHFAFMALRLVWGGNGLQSGVDALDVQFWNSETNRFWLFLKMDLILRTTVDMAVRSVAYSWQEKYPEKVLTIQERERACPRLSGRAGRMFQNSVSVIYIKSTFVGKYLCRWRQQLPTKWDCFSYSVQWYSECSLACLFQKYLGPQPKGFDQTYFLNI